MNDIEVIIVLLLLFMAVPDVCRRLGRPGLVFPAFVVFGMALGPVANEGVKAMLHGAGMVGFLLLLFQVGLEIDLPRPRQVLEAAGFAVPWALVQYPVVLLLAPIAGLGVAESLLAAATLTGVSVGMAYPAWKSYPGLAQDEQGRILRILILLEAIAIVLLAVEAPALKAGLNWFILLRLAGIALVVLLVARFAPHLTQLFQVILERATQWRTHLLVLLVLVVCAAGERLGLSAAKTAFFLGLFMSRAEHDGRCLEEYTAPVSERFLIPIFFVSLGLQVNWAAVGSLIGLSALGAAGLLIGVRQVLHRRWLRVGGDQHTYLLLCPNLTVVALGASSLLEDPMTAGAASWLLLTGLFTSVFAIASLPASRRGGGHSGESSQPNAPEGKAPGGPRPVAQGAARASRRVAKPAGWGPTWVPGAGGRCWGV